jgi:hypothetical protein
VAKKVPKERVQFEAPAAHVTEWKNEADLAELTLSEFIRRACKRYAKFRKQRRDNPDKSDDDSAG